MERTVVRTRTDRDVPVGRKDDGEGDSIGSDDCSQSGDDRITREDGDVVHRDDVSTDVLATDVADAGGGGTRDDTGKVSTPSDVASGDLEAKSGVVAFDGLRDGIEAMKRIVGDVEIEGGQNGTISWNRTIRGEEAKGLHVRRGVGEVIHAFVETSVSGGFDDGAGQIKIIENFESAGISQENAKT
jgi:hypothetical protein